MALKPLEIATIVLGSILVVISLTLIIWGSMTKPFTNSQKSTKIASITIGSITLAIVAGLAIYYALLKTGKVQMT